MICFNEPEKWAVGICRNCSRALCYDCLTEVQGILTCKERCEEHVKNQIKIFAYNKRATTIGFPSGILATAVSGALLFVLGIFLSSFSSKFPAVVPLVWALVIFGSAIIILCVRMHSRLRQIQKPKE
jgi:hypothetical protein